MLSCAQDKAAAAVAIQALNGARACIVAAAKLKEVEELEERIADLEATMLPGFNRPE